MKTKMKLQKTVTTSVIKRGKDLLIRKEICYPPDTTLNIKYGKTVSVTWHFKTPKGVINLYKKNEAEQLEEAYLKQIGDKKS